MENIERIHIKSFEILGLHGDKDITLSFGSPYKILVAENGTGKTTVLNSLFYLLTGQYQKLSRIEFEAMKLELESGVEIEILREDIYLEIPENLEKMPHFARLRNYIGADL